MSDPIAIILAMFIIMPILLPMMVYLCVKFGRYGYLVADHLFEQLHKENLNGDTSREGKEGEAAGSFRDEDGQGT